MTLRDHGELKRVRQALAVRLSVGCEPEHRLDQLPHLQRRTPLADEVSLVRARVPELVRRPGRNGDPLAGAGEDFLAPETEADRAAKDLETLLLEGVKVARRDEAVRLHEGFEDDRLAVRFPRSLAENEPLAGDPVLEDIAWMNHCFAPFV